MGDETLNGVLRNVFTEVSRATSSGLTSSALIVLAGQFLAGDFEMIRVFVSESILSFSVTETE